MTILTASMSPNHEFPARKNTCDFFLEDGTEMLAPKTPSWIAEFRTFIMRGNVVDLAVGIIIGAAFTGVVSSLVKDVFNPLLGLATGGVDFSNVFLALNGQHYANLADAQRAGAPTLNFGLFINAIIQFLIVSFAVFWVVKALTRLHVRQDAVAAPTKSELLLGEIRDLLAARSSDVTGDARRPASSNPMN
jgi:large conductance mechanosensitive channel